MDYEYEVLSPWAEADPIPLKGISPRLADLAGKKIGMFCNSKGASRPINNVVARKLRQRFPTSEISFYSATETFTTVQMEGKDKKRFVDWVSGVDAVIGAIGDWGSCTKHLVYEAKSIEEMHKPTVSLVNAAFVNDAASAASSRGMPGIRAVAESVPCECIVEEQIEPSIEAVMDEIVAALTKPLTDQEKNPVKEVEKHPRIAFKGNLQEINRFFYQRGWTDGLPIIPPTQEAVAEMLTGTDLPPDHVIAKIIPRLGKATVEKIAINAVMAGCLPTYMPVLIAGVQAALRPEVRLTAWGVSTGGFSPFWIINGPIRHDLHINSGLGVFNPGDIANAAIGRAMGLIIKNIGGARKGIEDMATFGHSGKYTMVVAENEEANPWDPLQVEAGFKKEDSTITLSFISSYTQILGYGTDDKGIMRAMVYNLTPAHGGMGGLLWFMLKPIAAEFLAKGGWTKKEMADFISEHARADFYRMPQFYRMAADPTENPGPRERLNLLSTGDSISLMGNWPGRIHFVVAGGVGGPAIAIIRGGRHDKVTQKIELPANWEQLTKKYKDIVPTYVRY